MGASRLDLLPKHMSNKLAGGLEVGCLVDGMVIVLLRVASQYALEMGLVEVMYISIFLSSSFSYERECIYIITGFSTDRC